MKQREVIPIDLNEFKSSPNGPTPQRVAVAVIQLNEGLLNPSQLSIGPNQTSFEGNIRYVVLTPLSPSLRPGMPWGVSREDANPEEAPDLWLYCVAQQQ